jgi:hypothetical protein
MHRQSLIATYTVSSTVSSEARTVFIQDHGPTADAPSCRPQVPEAEPRTRGATRVRRGLLAVLAALAVNAFRALMALIR